MPQCTFCGVKEEKETPLCQSCGAIRYPVDKKLATTSSKDKLKISAAIAAAIVTPGSFIVLALAGAAHLTTKSKSRK